MSHSDCKKLLFDAKAEEDSVESQSSMLSKDRSDDTDEETITTVKGQLKAALMEEVMNYLQYKLSRIKGEI